jgi:hypothetical protein
MLKLPFFFIVGRGKEKKNLFVQKFIYYVKKIRCFFLILLSKKNGFAKNYVIIKFLKNIFLEIRLFPAPARAQKKNGNTKKTAIQRSCG